ncbi:hypothetical protein vseg_001858 [Gypsophila vaccaria]
MDQQRHAQKTLDHENAHSLPKTITKISLETHATEIYTMKVFFDFQDEVHKSVVVCGVCGFKKLEDVKFIPDKYILARWTKGALKRPVYDLNGNTVEDYQTMVLRKIEISKLWSEIQATVRVLATKNLDDITKVISVIKEYKEKWEPTSMHPNNKQK